MLPGTTIAGRFRVWRLAGTGGMGAVYEAQDDLTGEKVALKILTSGGVSATERFLREGALLAEFSHPSIVRYVAHGATESGERYLVMEWLDGEELRDRLDHKPLSLAESVNLISRVARALGAMHARQILHRDVKPSNVFLVGGSIEAPKLLDFGIARAMPEGNRVTGTGMAIGTPGYMSPEQVRAENTLDARSDVFSLGCMFFECLTGRQPFLGGHAIAILARIVLEPAPIPSDSCPWVPSSIDALVLSMLAKDPEDRPADGAAVALALSRLDDLAVELRPPASAALPSARALTESEQRMVSVVLGAAPSDALTLSADEVGEVERGLDEVAEMRGVKLETLADGSILALFGGEGAATDRAMNVARAALRIHELLPSVPLAIATGKLLVSARSDASLSIGEAVDRAARALLSSRSIAIDVTTARLLDARFEVRGEDDALELIGEHSSSDETRTVLGRRTPCVGREREIAILTGVLEECATDAVARGVLVVGPPGIGKSRIRHEFLRRVERRDDPVTVWIGRADPVGFGSPFALLAQALRRAAGILEGEPLLLRQAKLAAMVAANVDKSERARVTEFLAVLVGAPFSDEEAPKVSAARGDAMAMGDEMRRAFEDFVAAESGARPLLLVLEDIHWGDRPTIQWIDAALRNLTDKPFMVLALARPEVHDVFPALWSERSITEINVSELSRKAAEKLVRDVLGSAADATTTQRIVDRASGNAFYLEELIRAAADGGASALPETVLAMVHARLSRLDPEARLVLRAGSVFGQAFWASGLEGLLPKAKIADLDGWLRMLVEREFIERKSKSRFPEQEEYAFRHALVRDAAYSMLTGADLEVGHRRAGAWLERSGERDAVVLAEHFELGGQMGRALEQIRIAAEQALEGNDFGAAVARVERGKRAGAAGSLLGHLLLVEAEARRWRGEWLEVVQPATDAMALLSEGTVPWFAAATPLTFALARLGLVEPALALATRVRTAPRADGADEAYFNVLPQLAIFLIHAGEVEASEAIEAEISRVATSVGRTPRITAQHHCFLASRAHARAEIGGVLENLLAAIDCFADIGDRRWSCRTKVNAGFSATELGLFELGEAYLREALRDAARMGLSDTVRGALENLGKLLARGQAIAEAKSVLGDAIQLSVQAMTPRGEGVCRAYLAELLLRVGELEDAEREAERAVAIFEPLPPMRALPLAILARVRLARGATREALAAATEANEVREAFGGSVEEGDAVVRLALAEALLANGDTDAAHRTIALAEARLRERASTIENRVWRESFFENVEENRLTLELANTWADGRAGA